MNTIVLFNRRVLDQMAQYTKALSICFLAYGLLFMIDPALAEDSADPLGTVQELSQSVFSSGVKVILVLGGIGILALAVMAFFGKFKPLWLISLVAGLVLVLIANELITYLSGEDISLTGDSE